MASRTRPDPGITRCGSITAREQVCHLAFACRGQRHLCLACRSKRSVPEHRSRRQRLEAAKRRLLYGLLALGLPVVSKQENAERDLAFAFLADPGPRIYARATR